MGEPIAISVGAVWAWSKLKAAIEKHSIEIVNEGIASGKDAAAKKAKDAWQQVDWKRSEEAYKTNLTRDLGVTRVLGNPKPINIQQIYTDVFVFDKLTAFRRYSENLLSFQNEMHEQPEGSIRHAATTVALSGENLYILGKPGAGKTTFLKHLAMLACSGKIKKTPIYVSLKDWSDSSLSIIPYIAKQFEVCGFPTTQSFVEKLLERGSALVLLDGLDEVNEWQAKRANVIREIVAFSKKYRKAQICLTCRIAATDYSFESFKYIEIADFTRIQQLRFVKQWYGKDAAKLGRFISQWRRRPQKGLRDLARTPVLLTLICLAFDETLDFPTRIVDLYREALEALLKKWDSSRNIKRDEFYKNLAPSRRENLLETIAAHFYFNSRFAFTRDELCEQVLKFIKLLPESKDATPSDCADIVKSIEAQHGLLVERAVCIYTFSHLTFQEYFTARYIVQSPSLKLIEQIVSMGLEDQRWREVLLYTSSLMMSADSIIKSMIEKTKEIRDSDEGIIRFLYAAQHLEFDWEEGDGPPLTIAELRKVHEHLLILDEFLNGKTNAEYDPLKIRVNSLLKNVKREPQRTAAMLGGYFARPDRLLAYLYACRLLVECLEVSMTSHRVEAIRSLLTLDVDE